MALMYAVYVLDGKIKGSGLGTSTTSAANAAQNDAQVALTGAAVPCTRRMYDRVVRYGALNLKWAMTENGLADIGD